MGVRGRKPTATVIKLATGNPGKRALPEDEPTVDGSPVVPAWLKGRGLKLWNEVMEFAYWLTVADSYKLAAWCDRQADFEKSSARKAWTAADRREHRSLGSELGLDPSSRARLGANLNGAKKPEPKKDAAGKYF